MRDAPDPDRDVVNAELNRWSGVKKMHRKMPYCLEWGRCGRRAVDDGVSSQVRRSCLVSQIHTPMHREASVCVTEQFPFPSLVARHTALQSHGISSWEADNWQRGWIKPGCK